MRQFPRVITTLEGVCRRHIVVLPWSLGLNQVVTSFLVPLFPLLPKEGEGDTIHSCKKHWAQHTIPMIHFWSDKTTKRSRIMVAGTLPGACPYNLHLKTGNLHYTCGKLVETILYHKEQLSWSSQGHRNSEVSWRNLKSHQDEQVAFTVTSQCFASACGVTLPFCVHLRGIWNGSALLHQVRATDSTRVITCTQVPPKPPP